MPLRARTLTLLAAVISLAACGPSPLDSLGSRSSDWINEPKIATTIPVVTTFPVVATSNDLLWSNDVIATLNLEDPEALIAEIFARREGDRFIQARRAEIAAALPDVGFPALVPSAAEWVSSQLVIENSGELSSEPSAAFGIWSAEPYTRSRSVAQMAVLRVSTDPAAAAELAEPGAEVSCARFADRSTKKCAVIEVNSVQIWQLISNSGVTLIWFGGPYRYELFGRSFVSRNVLEQMAGKTVRLADLGPPTP